MQKSRTGNLNTVQPKNPRLAWSRKLYLVIARLCAVVGLIAILTNTTPLVHAWAIASTGPIEHPNGDILIVLSAARDPSGGMSFSSSWRARQAVEAWKARGFTRVVLRGAGVSAMSQFLVAEGILPESIIVAHFLAQRWETDNFPRPYRGAAPSESANAYASTVITAAFSFRCLGSTLSNVSAAVW